MSDISLLSYHYQRIVEISNKINDAVIVLRKRAISADKKLVAKYQNLIVKKEIIKSARDEILLFLKEIKAVFENKAVTTSQLPNFLIRSFGELIQQSPYLKTDLDNLIHALSSGKELTPENFELLDKILSVVDEDRSNVFRKLRSRRGRKG